MKSGILPQAPGKKIACAIFEIGLWIYLPLVPILKLACHFSIGLSHFYIGPFYIEPFFNLVANFVFGLHRFCIGAIFILVHFSIWSSILHWACHF